MFCLLMDAAGFATYAVPFLGELADLLWAPLSAYIFFRCFGQSRMALLQLAEELLPGADFIPSFTLMWAWRQLHMMRARFTM